MFIVKKIKLIKKLFVFVKYLLYKQQKNTKKQQKVKLKLKLS